MITQNQTILPSILSYEIDYQDEDPKVIILSSAIKNIIFLNFHQYFYNFPIPAHSKSNFSTSDKTHSM